MPLLTTPTSANTPIPSVPLLRLSGGRVLGRIFRPLAEQAGRQGCAPHRLRVLYHFEAVADRSGGLT